MRDIMTKPDPGKEVHPQTRIYGDEFPKGKTGITVIRNGKEVPLEKIDNLNKSSHDFCNSVHVDKAGNKLVCILGEGHKGKHYSGSLDVGFEWDNEA